MINVNLPKSYLFYFVPIKCLLLTKTTICLHIHYLRKASTYYVIFFLKVKQKNEWILILIHVYVITVKKYSFST